MTQPKSFLFSMWEGGGNVPPVLGVASRLIKRGHRVRILAEPCLEISIKNIGASYIPFKKHFTRTDRSIDIIKDWQAKPLCIPSVDNILIKPALDVANQTLEELENEHTDVVVADFMMPGSLFAAEVKGIPRVALFHMPEYLPGSGRPPGGLGLLPSPTRLGKLRDSLLTRIFNAVLNQYLPSLNDTRKTLSLKPYQNLTDMYHAVDLRLIQTCKAFDAPIEPAPKNARYVGPVLDDPTWSETDEGIDDNRICLENDPRPLAVVSLSSTFQNQAAVLQRIIDALKNADILCLVTLGPAMEKEHFSISGNVILLPAIPHNKILPFADIVITHAGHGTVMRSLAHGVPLVCMPMGRDQLDNATLVAHHGAGIKLSAKASSKTISKSIKRLLEEPAFKRNAQRLQQSIVADAQANLAVSYLENLAVV